MKIIAQDVCEIMNISKIIINYKVIAADLRKKKELDADREAIQQIEFVW